MTNNYQKQLTDGGQVALDVGGAGRGANNAIPAVARLAPSLGSGRGKVRISDPAYGKADLVAERCRALGVDAVASTERIEDTVRRDAQADWPLTIHIDRARGVRAVAETVWEQGARRPVYTQFFLRLADSKMLSLLAAIPRGDEISLEKLGWLAEGMTPVLAPGGYDRFFNAESNVIPAGLEAIHRKVQLEDFEKSMPRLAADLEIERPPIAIFTGAKTIPVEIVRSPSPTGWAASSRLAQRVADNSLITERGSDFAIFELGGPGIRLLMARNRSDRPEIEVLGADELRPEQWDPERAIREAWTGIATRRAPLYMTE